VLGNFDYVCVRSVEEGCRLLAEADGAAKVLAGGTDLLVDIRNAARSPSLLVDIKSVEELSTLSASADGDTSIGATVPLNTLIEDKIIRERFPGLVASALSIGTYQIRNRATLAGNLCNGSPAADAAPILLALGADVQIVGDSGERTIPVSDLFLSVKRTCLESDEIVTEIRIPSQDAGTRSAFLKQQRIRGHDLAIVNVAGSYAPDTKTLKVAVGSCAPTPILLDPIDASGAPSTSIADQVVEVAETATSPISDVRASAEYRRAVLPVLLRRLIQQLLDGKGHRR
jgi:CO/xanthine dehydrogenase FAD-binding subunit